AHPSAFPAPFANLAYFDNLSACLYVSFTSLVKFGSSIFIRDVISLSLSLKYSAYSFILTTDFFSKIVNNTFTCFHSFSAILIYIYYHTTYSHLSFRTTLLLLTYYL